MTFSCHEVGEEVGPGTQLPPLRTVRSLVAEALVAPILLQKVAMPPKGSEGPQPENTGSGAGTSTVPSFFTVPAPIKRLFDRFPLTTYPPNDLPQRSPSRRHDNQLYVFSDAKSARNGRPSFNPQCLKWQVRDLPKVSAEQLY